MKNTTEKQLVQSNKALWNAVNRLEMYLADSFAGGFKFLTDIPIDPYGARGYVYEHTRTGAIVVAKDHAAETYKNLDDALELYEKLTSPHNQEAYWRLMESRPPKQAQAG